MQGKPPTSADGASASESEIENLKLEEQKTSLRQKIAEEQLATIKAEKSSVEAYLPAHESKPLEGKTELDEKAGSLVQLMAYEALKDAASAIAEEVKEGMSSAPSHRRILVVEDRSLVTSDWPYTLVSATLAQYSTALKKTFQELEGLLPSEAKRSPSKAVARGLVPSAAITTIPTVVLSAIGAAADIAGMFRSNYMVSGRDTTLANTALVAATCGELKSEEPKTRGKSKGSESTDNTPIDVRVDGFHLLEDALLQGSKLMDALKNATGTRVQLEIKKSQLEGAIASSEQEITDLRAGVEAIRTSYGNALATVDSMTDLVEKLKESFRESRVRLAEKERQVAQGRALIALATKRIEDFDAFHKAITEPQEKGYPPLVAAILREALHSTGESAPDSADNSNKGWYILFLGVDSSGGDIVTRQSLFRDARNIGIAAQCQVSWMLLDANTGMIVKAGTESRRRTRTYDIETGRWKSSRPRNDPNQRGVA